MLGRGLAGQDDMIPELPPSPTSHVPFIELRWELVSQCSGPHHNTVFQSPHLSHSCTSNIYIYIYTLIFSPWSAQHVEKLENKNCLGIKSCLIQFELSEKKKNRSREDIHFKTQKCSLIFQPPICSLQIKKNKNSKLIVWQILKWNISVTLSFFFFVTGCSVLFFPTEILAEA